MGAPRLRNIELTLALCFTDRKQKLGDLPQLLQLGKELRPDSSLPYCSLAKANGLSVPNCSDAPINACPMLYV